MPAMRHTFATLVASTFVVGTAFAQAPAGKSEYLSRCAGCHGEMDVMGNVYKAPETPLTPASIRLARIDKVGGYAVQLARALGAR